MGRCFPLCRVGRGWVIQKFWRGSDCSKALKKMFLHAKYFSFFDLNILRTNYWYYNISIPIPKKLKRSKLPYWKKKKDGRLVTCKVFGETCQSVNTFPQSNVTKNVIRSFDRLNIHNPKASHLTCFKIVIIDVITEKHRLNWKMILRVVNKQNNNSFVSELLWLVVYLSANCKVYGGGNSSFSNPSVQYIEKSHLLLTWKSIVYRDEYGRSFLYPWLTWLGKHRDESQ